MISHTLFRPVLPVLILIAGCTLLSVATEKAIPPDDVLHDQDVSIYNYEKYGVTILSIPDSFDFFYQPGNTATVEEVAQQRGYRFVINGSYFHANRSHAGMLKIDGRMYSAKIADPQLTHIVVKSKKQGAIRFVPALRYTSNEKQCALEFQTGPLVIENGRLARRLIQKSVNGPGAYRRTLLAMTDLKQVYFITVRAQVSLETLGNFLLRASVFSGKRLDVVNLDGGSSVALWAKDLPKLNFNQDARLPILLGVR